MEFKKIQLTGFKSFVERTTFLIENGLTGIVGPNGCGKSNIVESLRWCMGETSAKSMRGSGMEDVIFSGTANKPSKNIAEVVITLNNFEKEGSVQFKELEIINVKRKIEKDKGSKYFINEKEVRARDAQTFFADLSTGAHSPSIISQGRIGALVTAKPSDRRAILEEAAGISGLHARRHESELRLNSAENNLKRADELRKQQEKQLENLKKQAEEATKYKKILEEIKKFEAGLYYLRLQEIENDIKLENESVGNSDDDISGLTIELNHNEDLLKGENAKLKPLRDKNIEILSRLQRFNLELKNLEEQEIRIKSEKNNLIDSGKTLEIDIDREKRIIIDASSNEKRLKEEKKELIDIESKYYDLEKQANKDLVMATENLKNEQLKLEKASRELTAEIYSTENVLILKNSLSNLEKCSKYIKEENIEETNNLINKTKENLNNLIINLEESSNDQTSNEFSAINNKIKILQENYTSLFSKNQTIKADSIKRQERLKNIDNEIKNWQNLNLNSEKMLAELNSRKEKISNNLTNLEKLPENISVEKGQTLQSIKITEEEKLVTEEELKKAESVYEDHAQNLKIIQEKIMGARENRASATATLEGLKNRKKDLLNHIENDHITIEIKEKLTSLFSFSKFKDVSKDLMKLRIIKSKEEIEIIKSGAKIADIGAEEIVKHIKVGASELEIAMTGRDKMELEIAKKYPEAEYMDTWVWFQSGINTDGAHNPKTSRKLVSGDILSLNTFPMISGYYTALERTLFLNNADDDSLKAWEANIKVHKRGLELIKPGVKCSEICHELNDIFAQLGYLQYRTFGYGHSFGVLSHFYGRETGLELREDIDTILQPNMVISMEPMIMIPEGKPGSGGYREHDMLIVNDNGAENITKFPIGPEKNIIKN